MFFYSTQPKCSRWIPKSITINEGHQTKIATEEINDEQGGG